MAKIKTTDKASIWIRSSTSKSTEIGFKETKIIKVLNAMHTAIDHTVISL